MWEGEHQWVDPSDDEDFPAALPGVHPSLPEHFSLLLASLDPRLTTQSVRRLGDPLDSGPEKEQRSEKDPEETDSGAAAQDPRVDMTLAADLTAYGLLATGAENSRLARLPGGRRNAIDSPTMGWSSLERL